MRVSSIEGCFDWRLFWKRYRSLTSLNKDRFNSFDLRCHLSAGEACKRKIRAKHRTAQFLAELLKLIKEMYLALTLLRECGETLVFYIHMYYNTHASKLQLKGIKQLPSTLKFLLNYNSMKLKYFYHSAAQ